MDSYSDEEKDKEMFLDSMYSNIFNHFDQLDKAPYKVSLWEVRLLIFRGM